MARWRGKALELLPEFSTQIQRLDNPYMFWIELGHEFKRAYETPRNEDLIRCFYTYADWCWRQRQKELWNSVAVCFYEHLPDRRAVRDDMPRWLSPDKFRDLAGLFEWRLGQDEFVELKRYYEANAGMYESNFGRSLKLARRKGATKRKMGKQVGK
jgi:hypothetical protein